MSVLSKKDQNTIQTTLEKERDKLQKNIENLVKQDPFSDPDRASDNVADSDAQEESDHDRVSAQIKEQQKQLYFVNEALMRITNNTYGTCISCGASIDPKRLHAAPTASRCLSCAEK